MTIDNYAESFDYLVNSDFPRYMAFLQNAINNPVQMGDFAIDGVGLVGLCRQFSHESDFPGCYILLDLGVPIYVGISRAVLQRLRQHVRGTTHFDASLAYRIAAEAMPHTHTRAKAMDLEEFKAQFDSAKNYLRGLQVAYVRIDNPLVLYVFEPYCAMKFGTSRWNTFETH
jgi:hypothetical protein